MNGALSRRSVLRGAGALGLASAGGLAACQSPFAPAGNATGPQAAQGPQMTVTRHASGVAPGQILFTHGNGVEIADADGRPLWTMSGSEQYGNFQMQTYQGKDVLTWWQGTGGPAQGGFGLGIDLLTSLEHDPVATIMRSGEYRPDVHEFRITPSNTALITSYRTVARDLSAVGGPTHGRVLNSYCEEVDIASGRVLHRWSALDHIPLADSYLPVPAMASQPYDYFHINSIDLTPDHHLLVSARHTSALYKVHRTTGQVIWRLGGKSSSFSVAKNAVFAYQHHAAFEGQHTIRLFDDGGDGFITRHPTRVIWIRIDTAAMTASLANSMSIPGIQSAAMGSAQRLPNGSVFVCWGSTPRLSEFSASGEVLFDASLAFPSYRAFKFQIP